VKQIKQLLILVLLLFLVMFGSFAFRTQAADHLEAPIVAQDGRIDINDVYLFQSPTNPANSVYIMTINPAAGILSPTSFHPKADYVFNIDNDGNNVADVKYLIQFGTLGSNGEQTVRVRQVGGSIKVSGRGTTGQTINLSNGGKVLASLFDDPFFFDLQAFRDQVKGAGGSRTFCDANAVDFFAGFQTNAIVLEVPSAAFMGSNSTVNVWGSIALSDEAFGATFGNIQERMGKPAIATVLIPDHAEDAFNDDKPNNDIRLWSDSVRTNLLALSGLDGSGYSAAEADAITGVLLPDVLTFDPTSSAGFVPGLNGRQLADDVIDFELFVVTGGLGAANPPAGTAVLASDCIDANDIPFSGVFPYLAVPVLNYGN
jgi:hypothetical protein